MVVKCSRGKYLKRKSPADTGRAFPKKLEGYWMLNRCTNFCSPAVTSTMYMPLAS